MEKSSKPLKFYSCPRGHQYTAPWKYARSKKNICPICLGLEGIKIIVGYNDMSANYPKLYKELSLSEKDRAFELEEQGHRVCDSDRFTWTCPKCGHEWESTIKERLEGTKCPGCIAQKKLKKAQIKTPAEWPDDL